MNKKKIQVKMMLSMIFMYFIAPQIWGLWMVFKLKIINFNEYLHLATSPLTIFLLGLFFYINRKYYTRISEQLMENKLSHTPKKFQVIPLFHLLSILLFGTVATFLAMLSLYFPQLGFFITIPISFSTVIVGTVAGASLTFIFFFLFTSILIGSFDAIAGHHKISNESLFFRYLPWNLILVILGMFLMVFSTVKATAITGNTLNTEEFIKLLNFNLLTLLLPISAGTFLLFKQTALSSKLIQIKTNN